MDPKQAVVRAWRDASTERYVALVVLPEQVGPVATGGTIAELGAHVDAALRDYEYRGPKPKYYWLGNMDRPSLARVRQAPVLRESKDLA